MGIKYCKKYFYFIAIFLTVFSFYVFKPTLARGAESGNLGLLQGSGLPTDIKDRAKGATNDATSFLSSTMASVKNFFSFRFEMAIKEYAAEKDELQNDWKGFFENNRIWSAIRVFFGSKEVPAKP
ncbi:MAG: hypothetical protein WC449_02055 [Candidatus Paceibacterota bacterium]